jgi:hypothetical protein
LRGVTNHKNKNTLAMPRGAALPAVLEVHRLSPLECLRERSVAVIPFAEPLGDAGARMLEAAFLSPLFAQRPASVQDLVLGGFGASADPHLYHCEERLRLDALAYESARPVFAEFYSEAQWEMILDRWCIRVEGRALTREGFHRDHSPGGYLPQRAEIYGGWMNLSEDTTQYLWIVPQARSRVNSDLKQLPFTAKTGFRPMDAAEAAQWEPQLRRVAVPPGHMLLFRQELPHKVPPERITKTSTRLFTAFRVIPGAAGKEEEPLIREIDRCLEEQATPPLKSGQAPPMYANNHNSYGQEALSAYCQRMFPARFLHASPGTGRAILWQRPPSLRALALTLHAPRSAEERRRLRPHSLFKRA